jgi:cytochrome b6-f complex subunit 5
MSHPLSISKEFDVVEPLLSGIVLGLIPITLAGLFVAAYLQYKRGNELEL